MFDSGDDDAIDSLLEAEQRSGIGGLCFVIAIAAIVIGLLIQSHGSLQQAFVEIWQDLKPT